MTTKDPAVRAAAAIDFTMMYATHDAFRRDLGRLKAAATAGTAQAPGVRAGWENFKAQLLLHHSVEDTDLWPRVSHAAADRPSGLALLADAAVAGLASALEWHLKHEEDAALPLIQSVCTPADWRAFADAMRRAQGIKGAARYVPWILDGIAREKQRRFMAALPAPVRVISRILWEPRYRQRGLWRS